MVPMVALGVWLLWFDFNRLAHRAFAAFFLRAGTVLASVLRANASVPMRMIPASCHESCLPGLEEARDKGGYGLEIIDLPHEAAE